MTTLIEAIAANIEAALLADPRDYKVVAAETWPDVAVGTAEQRLTRLRGENRRVDLRRLAELEVGLGLRVGTLLLVPNSED